MTDAELQRIDALIGVGLRLARSAPSGRVLLARIATGIDPAWVPRPWGDQLATELEAAKVSASQPLESKQVQRALRDAWGARPSEILDDLDPDPVASTPTSQVHRGVLDGAPVAVKVLRPGLAGMVRQDLVILDALLAPLGAAFPALDARAVLREFRERVLDELDLEQEAATQRRFQRALRRHPWLMVPTPIMRLAREGALISEWVDGIPLWRAPDPDQAAARLVGFALGGLASGIVHADPDPDDVLVLPDGRLAILDFGAWSEVQPGRVALALAAFDAFLGRDAQAFAGALEQLGALPRSSGATALDLIRTALGKLGEPGPARLDGDAVLAARDRLLEQPQAMAELIRAGALAPQDLWPARAVTQLFATIARVGATGDWPALTRAGLHEGWGQPAP
jgi:predicted unusual protein kinase regulating ubiquinone biosynthesis (AarF/ABC1/UbiB family)